MAAASAGPRGRGPMISVSMPSTAARSTGSPSADNSAHSSSAVDSARAVPTLPPSSCPSRLASCSRAAASAAAAPSTGASAEPSATLNRSGSPVTAGISSGFCPCRQAHTYPASARHPPNSSRCTAATSQQVASRTPAATSPRASCCDQTTHRGRIFSSASPTSATDAPHSPPSTATLTAPPLPTTSPTRSPCLTPPSASAVTRSPTTPIIAHQFDPSPRGGDAEKTAEGRRTRVSGRLARLGRGNCRTRRRSARAAGETSRARPGGWSGNSPPGGLPRGVLPREIDCVRGRNERAISYRRVPPSRRRAFPSA